jgi:16S rRNA (guanine527-N7)-methyltransferase
MHSRGSRPEPDGADSSASVDLPVGGARRPIDPRPPTDLVSASERLFGDRLPLAVRYADLLVTEGVVRGLIGPRETPRIWDRHLLNCAAVADLIPPDTFVVDVGSGAGLPGVVLAVARPDLSIVLLEPLARRTTFLSEVVAALDLDRVTVLRARAEDCVDGRGAPRLSPADVVTARALAPLDRLAAWCLPLANQGGRVLALKGESVAEELIAHRTAIARLGGGSPIVRRCGTGVLERPTIVVEIVRERHPKPPVSRLHAA